MTIDKTVWDHENSRLRRVIEEIESQLEESENAAGNYRREAIKVQKKMWEEAKSMPQDLTDLEGPAMAWQYQTEIDIQARKYKFASEKAYKLALMHKSPYFGRIDFTEGGDGQPEQLYIGLHNLNETKSGDFLVLDWRAPICSMFYDHEVGKGSYTCPGGVIYGDISLKRQYKIDNQKISYMFDSSLTINDSMLQQLIGKSVDNRMKTIVSSIQREQNSVIRNCDHDIVIVQGVAGSGKTSIALHRAAFILYRYKDELRSDNLMILSPNRVFSDYISTVLPELGEENLKSCTFGDLYDEVLGGNKKKESFYEQMEYILGQRGHYQYKARLKSIELKGSITFLNLLREYITLLEGGETIDFRDICFQEHLIMSREEMHDLYTREYAMFPVSKRLAMIAQRLDYLLRPWEEGKMKELLEGTAEEGSHVSAKEIKAIAAIRLKALFKNVRDEIKEITTIDIYQIYSNLFSNTKLINNLKIHCQDTINDICRYTLGQMERGIINYEDFAPMVYLKNALEGGAKQPSIKHVIVDEAQDYTLLQIEVLKQTFGYSKMTILGDLSQAINPYMNIGQFSNIKEVFGDKNTVQITLNKSYRSTREIADFCRKILPQSQGVEYLNRKGEAPRLVKVENAYKAKIISQDIKELQGKGCSFIAVICKSEKQTQQAYQELGQYLDLSIITQEQENYPRGVVVMPSYLAKGLEFDGVFVYEAGQSDYSKEDERKLLYTVCTRALHHLNLYYEDTLSPFIPQGNS